MRHGSTEKKFAQFSNCFALVSPTGHVLARSKRPEFSDRCFLYPCLGTTHGVLYLSSSHLRNQCRQLGFQGRVRQIWSSLRPLDDRALESPGTVNFCVAASHQHVQLHAFAIHLHHRFFQVC